MCLKGFVQMIKFSVLDYAVIDEGQMPETALKETVKLAQAAERLGFQRFWMAEHHDVNAFASSSPELLMMHILGQTSSIRLGSGGVMIPHYSPLKVAENFRVMESLYPGRVDLGVGNTLGTPAVNKSMNEMRPRKQRYEENISDIKNTLRIPMMRITVLMRLLQIQKEKRTRKCGCSVRASARRNSLPARVLGIRSACFPMLQKIKLRSVKKQPVYTENISCRLRSWRSRML